MEVISSARENEDPLLDPEWAAFAARQHFTPQLDAAASLRDFGVGLLKRLLKTSSEEPSDFILIAAMLRQSVAAYDAWLHDATAGGTEAAASHARVLFEADLTSQWAFQGDRARWARTLYVATARRRMKWARTVIAGTTEHTKFDADWKKKTGKAYEVRPRIAQAAAEEVTQISKLLASDTYNEINAAFNLAARPHDPPWYRVGVGGVRSIYAMAHALGRGADYSLLYSSLSAIAHGSDTMHHFRLGPDGPIVAPIRSPEFLSESCRSSATFFLETLRRFLSAFREGEIAVFNRKYLEEWRPLLHPPKISAAEQLVTL